MKNWMNRAFGLLKASLETPRQELNELDWKQELSPDKKRLSEHLSAFSNFSGGGFLVYGVNNQGIIPSDISQERVEAIVKQLTNLAREAIEPPVALDCAVEDFESVRVLFIHVPESPVKPVHLRGKPLDVGFIRSGGTTRRASRQEIGMMMLNSRTPRWEELRATLLISNDEIRSMLNMGPILAMLERPSPSTKEEMLELIFGERFALRDHAEGGYITNLGAIAAAKRLSDFPDISRKSVRVIVYDGLNKQKTKQEQEGQLGYAISFQRLMEFVMSLLPQSEVIEQALRRKRTVYPEIALREIIANALIHQDFTITGAGPLIEIYNDRIEISNPGGLLPSQRLDRLIGAQPESRNEQLARAFRRYKICEERGSGLIKAGIEVEMYGLPPIEFTNGGNFFKVTLYTPRTFAQMADKERLEACYQHAVLKYRSDSTMTNTSLRERLKMPERQRSMVSLLIQEAIDKNYIKAADPENTSKKFTEYVPVWA
jgi:predicted HTH transcriptional regulator